jgi:hypothetical protein
MQVIGKIEPKEKPSEDQASYSKESSTQVFAQICIPLIEDDVYSISYFFSKFHVEYIWHASHRLHVDTFSMCNACISGDKKGAAHIRLNYDIL